MTNNEIMKALECCYNSKAGSDCDGCPYIEFRSRMGCLDELLEDTIKLINQYEAEIKRNQDLLEALSRNGLAWDRTIQFNVNKAIKDFAERLKREVYTEKGFSVFSDDTIDNLVEEMVGEE